MLAPWSSKKECRSFFKALCAQEFAQGLVQNQSRLSASLHTFCVLQSGLWGAYRALPEEAQVEEVFNIPHITWVFPRMHEGLLHFLKAQSFVKGPMGILEPDQNSTFKSTAELQGVLVPGLSFNKNGSRLGKGKGFYDKTLSTFQGVKVGICFDFQISEFQLPIEAHDVKMDFLVTDSGWIDCSKYQE